jgi:hypothetical protein
VIKRLTTQLGSSLLALLTIGALFATPAAARTVDEPDALGKDSVTSYHIATGGISQQGDFSEAIYNLLRTPAVNSVTQNALRPDVVNESKLSPGVRLKLNAAGPAEVFGKSGTTVTIPPTVIEHLGGKYFGDTTATADDRYTTLGTMTLPAGTWQVFTSVKFNRTEAGDAGARPQVGLRIGQDQTADADSRFGRSVGTVGGNDISPAKGHDLFGSTSEFIELDEPTEVGVYGFGYTNTGGTEGSGQITAAVSMTPVRVG